MLRNKLKLKLKYEKPGNEKLNSRFTLNLSFNFQSDIGLDFNKFLDHVHRNHCEKFNWLTSMWIFFSSFPFFSFSRINSCLDWKEKKSAIHMSYLSLGHPVVLLLTIFFWGGRALVASTTTFCSACFYCYKTWQEVWSFAKC